MPTDHVKLITKWYKNTYTQKFWKLNFSKHILQTVAAQLAASQEGLGSVSERVSEWVAEIHTHAKHTVPIQKS
jgi:hypothetical protein